MDNQLLDSLQLPPEQQKMFTMLYQMMELQGKEKQMELMIEMFNHIMAIKEIMDELSIGYGG